MPEKSVAQKAHVKPGTTISITNRVPGIVESLGLPADVVFVRTDAQLIFLFVRTQAELEEKMPAAVERMGPGSAVWVFFQKGSKQAGLDINRDSIWALAERLGLRPLGLMSVDAIWSAFRLRRSEAAATAKARKTSARGRRTSG